MRVQTTISTTSTSFGSSSQMPAIRESSALVDDSLAARGAAERAIGRPTATARKPVEASISPNTRRAYADVLGQLDA